ncbi:MAG: hypothetical protein QM811_12440 [Pirellulales bacterium]
MKVGQLRDITLSSVHFRRDGQVALLGETAADVLDVLVHAEDFLHDQHDRKLARFVGHGAVGRNFAVGGGDFDFARFQFLRVRGDRIGRDRQNRQREAGRQRSDDEPATRDFRRAEKTEQFFMHGCDAQENV